MGKIDESHVLGAGQMCIRRAGSTLSSWSNASPSSRGNDQRSHDRGLVWYRGDSDVVWNIASREDMCLDNGRSNEGPSLEHIMSKVSSDRNANARASAREARS